MRFTTRTTMYYSDINPIYDVLERSCPTYSKNVSYVDVRLVQTYLDLTKSYGWWGGGGGGVVDSVRTQLSLGLNKNLKKALKLTKKIT